MRSYSNHARFIYSPKYTTVASISYQNWQIFLAIDLICPVDKTVNDEKNVSVVK